MWNLTLNNINWETTKEENSFSGNQPPKKLRVSNSSRYLHSNHRITCDPIILQTFIVLHFFVPYHQPYPAGLHPSTFMLQYLLQVRNGRATLHHYFHDPSRRGHDTEEKAGETDRGKHGGVETVIGRRMACWSFSRILPFRFHVSPDQCFSNL